MGMVISNLLVTEAGYINKMAISQTQDKLFLACEHGLRVIKLD